MIGEKPQDRRRNAIVVVCAGDLVGHGQDIGVCIGDRHGASGQSHHGKVVRHVTEGRHMAGGDAQAVTQMGEGGRLGDLGCGDLGKTGRPSA